MALNKIENVCRMETVIRNMIFWKKKWVDYKNYTMIALTFMQTIKDKIENVCKYGNSH